MFELLSISGNPSTILVLRDFGFKYDSWPVGGSVRYDALWSTVVMAFE